MNLPSLSFGQSWHDYEMDEDARVRLVMVTTPEDIRQFAGEGDWRPDSFSDKLHRQSLVPYHIHKLVRLLLLAGASGAGEGLGMRALVSHVSSFPRAPVLALSRFPTGGKAKTTISSWASRTAPTTLGFTTNSGVVLAMDMQPRGADAKIQFG